ncbi:hypothetical protein M0805_006464 [Coniferiporia weirii]|nr:hypothetical protein M0805_006464 [Coniferiporia weirii]
MSAPPNFDLHPFIPSREGDSRSPCPALNSLANHSYIPHSGHSIPFFVLIKAMRTVYNVSLPLAFLLTVGGFLMCGHFTGSGFSTRLELSLHDLSRHGRIEHDGSLGHADAEPGEIFAPSEPDPARLNGLLNEGIVSGKSSANSDTLSFFDLAKERFLRDRALNRPLGAFHAEITRGEVALIILTLGLNVGGPHASSNFETCAVPRDRIAQWFGEERLPVGYTVPSTQIGLLRTAGLARRVRAEVARFARYS